MPEDIQIFKHRLYASDDYLNRLKTMGLPTEGQARPNLAMEASLGALGSPIETLTGGLWDVGTGILKGIAQLAKAPFQGDKTTGDRVYDVGNLLTLGILDTFTESFKSTYNPDEPGSTMSYDEGIWNFVKAAILPIDSAKTLMTGRRADGVQLEPREWGQMAMSTALQLIPIVKGLSLLRGAVFKGIEGTVQRTVQSTAAKAALTSGDATKVLTKSMTFDDIIESSGSLAETFKTTNPPLVAIMQDMKKTFGVDPTIGDVVGFAKRSGFPLTGVVDDLTPKQLWTVLAESKDYIQNMAKTEPAKLNALIQDTALRTVARGGKEKKMNFLADMIANGGLAPNSIGRIFKNQMDQYGMTPGEAAKNLERVGELITNTGTRSGRSLNVLAQMSIESVEKAVGNNPTIRASIKALHDQIKDQRLHMSKYDRIATGYTRWLRWARASAVGQLATLVRNNLSQGAEATTKIWESAMSETRIFGESIVRGKPLPLVEAYAQTGLSLANMAHHLSAQLTHGKNLVQYTAMRLGKKTGPGTYELLAADAKFKSGYSYYDKIMKQLDPREQIFLEESAVNDVFTRSVFDMAYRKEMKDMMKSKDYSMMDKAAGAMDFWADIVTASNRVTEVQWRRYFFMDNMIRHSRARGYANLDDFFKAVESGAADTRKTWIGGFASEKEANTKLADVKKNLGSIVEEHVNKNTRVLQARYAGTAGAMKKTLDEIKTDTHKEWATSLNTAIKDMKDGGDMNTVLAMLPEDLIKKIGGVVENDMTVITRSVDRALKSTFAFTAPEHTFAGSILKLYHQFPFAAGLGPYFPRFLTNMWGWLGEHHPMLTQPEIKAFKGAKAQVIKKGTSVGANRIAIDTWAKRQDGYFLTGLATMTRATIGGPKYYQVWTGTTDENGDKVYFDVRPFQPFAQILFIQDIMQNIMEGRAPNATLTTAELADATLGVRRLQETPMFAFPDLMRMLDSEDPAALVRSIKRIIGTPLSMPFTPMRTFIDFMASAGVGDKWDDVKDLVGNELYGAPAQNIPWVRDTLPAQVDPFTGKKMENKSPALRQLLGASLNTYTPLQELMQETGMGLGDLTGSFKTIEATNLVRQNLGNILGMKLPNGNTMNKQISAAVKKATARLPVGFRRELLRDALGMVRTAAVNMSRQQNPRAFAQEQISRVVPEPFRKGFRSKLEDLGRQSKVPEHPLLRRKD